MDTFESALKSWDFILFDERTFRIIITHRKNSSPNLAHIHDFEIWERITKIKVGNKIMRVNGGKLNLEEIWSCSIQKIIKNSSWRTPRQHFACQNEKIQKQKKWKMMKIDIVLKFDVKVVAHSEAVQNTSTTSKLSILDHITSLKSELPPKNSYWKTAFLWFSVILRDTISYFRKVPKKNSYLKVLPMNSWDHGDAFCTISRYFLMIRSKVIWCWKLVNFRNQNQ